MGLEAIALGSLLFSGVSYIEQRKEAKASQRAQERSRQEQEAGQAQQAASERRRQVREERVKRARLLASSQATGTTGSSGEAGALSGLSTQLSSNIGFNIGSIDRAQRIGGFNQAASDAAFNSQQAGGLFQLGTSIFNASGGFGAFGSNTSASTSPQMSIFEPNNVTWYK